MAKRPSLVVRPPANEREIRTLSDLVFQSFSEVDWTPELTDWWLRHIGRENLRVVRRGRQIVGGLGILYFRQWFGGRSIDSAGITCVAILPEARGCGAGRHLMRTVVEELHAQGVALSSLYPSTYPLYRAAGYEPAAEYVTCEIDLNRLGVEDRSCVIRPMAAADREAVYALHRTYGRRGTGLVDRTPREWSRIFDFGTDRVYAYVVQASGQTGDIEGYVVYTQRPIPRAPYEIMVRDHAFLTPAAGRRLLTFFADHGTTARTVTYRGAHRDPLLALARYETRRVVASHYWMLRVVDAPRALRGRGYPAGVEAELHLEINDDVLPQNNGRFVLRVRKGRAGVRKGGDGRLRLDIRALAPLFSGHFSATQLALIGMVEGGPGDLALAGTVFAGPSPWMNDSF